MKYDIRQIHRFHLNSNMELLIFARFVNELFAFKDLNSNMELLIYSDVEFEPLTITIFKFQYGATNIASNLFINSSLSSFKFQYGATNIAHH